MRRLKEADFELVILDICLPGMNGLDALAQIRQIAPALPVIVMTGQGTTDTAIEATKRGAFDYQLEALRAGRNAADDRQGPGGGPVDERPPHPESRRRPPPPSDAIVGRSPPMQQLYKAIGRVAADRRHRAHPR